MAQRKANIVPEEALFFLKLLVKGKVSFVIVGGAALALHGIPRATLDIDIVVPADDKILAKLFSLAKQADFGCDQKDVTRFINRPDLLIGQWATFKDSRGNELFDVFFEDVRIFDKLRKRAIVTKAKEFRLYAACLDDLEQMKRDVGRPIDLADIALIQERRKKR